jgi:hypothetical protein
MEVPTLRLTRAQLPENRAQLVDLAAVRRPIARSLRGDGPIVVLLRLTD